MSSDNAALILRIVDEVWNAGDLDLADELFAPFYINRGGLIPDMLLGPETIKLGVALYRAAFPDLHITPEKLLVDGDTAVLDWTAWNATRALPSENASDDGRAALIGKTKFRIAGGQIAESWTSWDHGGLQEVPVR
jgi:hypothetical protein